MDAIFNHARDSLESARKAVDKLFDELRSRGFSEKYGDVGNVRQSIIDAEAELDGMASKWIEGAEKKMHGEGISFSDEVEMFSESLIYEDKWKSLEELTKEQELDFSKFFPGEE